MTKPFLIGLLILLTQSAFSQSILDKIEVGVSYNNFISGDYSTTYDAIWGAEASYNFYKKNKFSLSAGINTYFEIDNENASLFHSSIFGNARYHLFNIAKKPFSLEAQLGPLFSREELAVQLIDGERTFQEETFGFYGSGGLVYAPVESFLIKINAKQFNSEGTTVGGGIAYKF